MKKVLLTILGILAVIGVLAGAGFAGYRIGYSHAVLRTSNDTTQMIPRDKTFNPHIMPMRPIGPSFEHGFSRGWDRGGFGMRFGMLSPLFFLGHVAALVLVIWLVYKLIKNSGWQLSIKRQLTDNVKVETDTKQD